MYMLGSWFHSLPEASLLATLFAVGTVVLVVGLRRIAPRLPATIIVMLLSIVLAHIFRLSDAGLQLVADLAALPTGLPPLTLPNFGLWPTLLPAAIACSVLSLVESSSVARTLAARSGQSLDMATEFAGQGLANIAAAFSGGYPVSGSLARSTLNQQAGAQSRLSALFCGFMMLAVLLFFGPVVNQTPIASLAGLLFLLAIDLIAFERIRVILKGTLGDRAAFLTTLIGTWLFPLDQAVYIGVGISILLFLRRARLLTAKEMTISEKGRFREVDQIDLEQEEPGQPGQPRQRCSAIRILNLTGPLFFAASGELQAMLNRLSTAPDVCVVILRMRQTQGLDITIASLLGASQAQLAQNNKTLLVLGLRSDAIQLFEKTGIAAQIGLENIFPAQSGWFTAMEAALRRALLLAGEHVCGAACPFAAYLVAQDALRSEPES
jgi:SulP family sulfate permease